MPEFDVAILTVRSGTHTVRVSAGDAAAARALIEADCQSGRCHCPAEWCSDDVDSTIMHIRQVALDDVTIIGADGASRGTLYADDTLARSQSRRLADHAMP